MNPAAFSHTPESVIISYNTLKKERCPVIANKGYANQTVANYIYMCVLGTKLIVILNNGRI